MDIDRRTFLAWSAAAGIGVSRAGVAPLSAAPPSRADAARPVCIFSKHLQWLDYREMAELAAEIGFDGVDLTVRPGGHVLPERAAADLPRAVEAVRAAGLAVPMITTAIVRPDDPVTASILGTARDLGIRHYRMGYLAYQDSTGVAASLEAHRPLMRELAAMNEEYGLHGAYQNHAGTGVGGPVWDLWVLLRDLDPRWIGCQYDIRHAMVEGGTSWPLALKLLAPYIQITAIKDFHWAKDDRGRWRIANVPLREGMVDFDAYFGLVKELAIAGPISLHYEYHPFEGMGTPLPIPERRRRDLPLMRRDLESLRAMLASVAP